MKTRRPRPYTTLGLCAIALMLASCGENPPAPRGQRGALGGTNDKAAVDSRPWARLPDGRVMIVLHGIGLAFDPRLPDADKSVSSPVMFDAWDALLWLTAVVARPAVARAAFNKDPMPSAIITRSRKPGNDEPPFVPILLPEALSSDLWIKVHKSDDSGQCERLNYTEPVTGCDENHYKYIDGVPDKDGMRLKEVDKDVSGKVRRTVWLMSPAIRLSRSPSPIEYDCEPDYDGTVLGFCSS